MYKHGMGHTCVEGGETEVLTNMRARAPRLLSCCQYMIIVCVHVCVLVSAVSWIYL